VAAIDALLYLPGHPRDLLERALRIRALSPGWKSSFQALMDQDAAAGPSAWPGFRPLRVARRDRESAGVISLSFEAIDATPLPAALPGQFLVLKLRIKPDLAPILRNYSMSAAPGAKAYRVSIKQEVHGLGSTFLHNQIKVGDELEVSAPRGNFTLIPGDRPAVLMSAGIGATPVLAMLHALAAAGSTREVWWLYGARNRGEHPFAQESRELLKALARGQNHITYSDPGLEDRLGEDYQSAGRLNMPMLDQLGVPTTADFYLCGPASFLASFTAGLQEWGVPTNRIHSEIFGPAVSIAWHRPWFPWACSSASGTCGPGASSLVYSKRLDGSVGPSFQKPAGAR
jgi:ferredoxin-NADP reductase